MCLSIVVDNPELVLETGTHHGIEWVITQNAYGARCGYARIPLGHPWHGLSIDEQFAEVHGGITFSEPDKPCGKGGPDDAWWIGFDCMHAWDSPDPDLSNFQETYSRIMNGTVRSQHYVREECKSLCEQIIWAGPPSFFEKSQPEACSIRRKVDRPRVEK